MTQYVFGYPVALVLSDDRGEFEVNAALRFHERDGAVLDTERILDAINKRNEESVGPVRRPRY